MKRITMSACMLAATLSLGGCMDKASEPFRDAPQQSDINDGPAQIIEMPDGFSNLAAKCDGVNRVYVAFKGDDNRAALAVVPNDPRCSEK